MAQVQTVIPHYACSFCGKTQSEVFQMVAAEGRPHAPTICNECVAKATRIISARERSRR